MLSQILLVILTILNSSSGSALLGGLDPFSLTTQKIVKSATARQHMIAAWQQESQIDSKYSVQSFSTTPFSAQRFEENILAVEAVEMASAYLPKITELEKAKAVEKSKDVIKGIPNELPEFSVSNDISNVTVPIIEDGIYFFDELKRVGHLIWIGVLTFLMLLILILMGCVLKFLYSLSAHVGFRGSVRPGDIELNNL